MSPTPWSDLTARLQGDLVRPGAATYELLRRPFNQRIDQHPAAIARCVSEDDVAACVRFATTHGVTVTCRSGGHGAEGYCVRDDALMIDQSAMQQIELDTERGVVHVSAGCSWGQVDIATYPRGLAACGGGCAAVGVAGLSQGGGWGPISRTHGMTIDNVESVRIVTPREGRVIVADATQHEDLFWALRGGGGGNFGAVTRFTYRLHPIGRALLGGMLIFDWADAAQAFRFYRDWMRSPGVDPRLTLLPLFFLAGGNQPLAGISAFYNGDPLDGLAYVQKIATQFGMPALAQGQPLEAALAPGTLPAYTGTESTTAWPGSGQYWKSGFLRNDFPDEAIDTLLAWFADCPRPPADERAPHPTSIYKQDDLSFGFIESLGGAIGEVDPAGTAFPWREQLFSFTFIGIYEPGDGDWEQRTRAWAQGFRAAMEPHLAGGVYVNYMQGDLPDWPRAYYGDNAPRLREVKRTCDPDRVFRFPQDLLAAG